MVVDIINPYEVAVAQFDEAAERLGLSQAMRAILRKPKRELIVNFPVRMDNGDVEMFTGYRVQHNINRGPAKGGIRFSPEVSLDEAYWIAATVTGKPIAIGGSEGRLEATARGVQVITRDAMLDLGMRADECSVVIQGFGNVGSISARLLHELGCNVVGLSDIS